MTFPLLSSPHNHLPGAEQGAQAGYADVGDHRIYYTYSGDGPPVLLLHGGYLDLTMWNSQVSALTQNGFMAICLDDIGHGKTITGKEGVLATEVIDAVLDRLGVHQVDIVGLSWGAMMAVDYALKYPERVGKLMLISPGLSGWEYFHDEMSESNFEKRQRAKARGDKPSFVEYFLKNWTDGPRFDSLRIDAETRREIQSIITENTRNHWGDDFSQLAEPPAISRLGEIRTPTLVVTGDCDVKDILMIGQKLNEDLANSQWVTVKNAAHTLNMEKPDQTNQLLLKFLANP